MQLQLIYVSTAVFIASAIFFIILERIIPYDRGQKFVREGFFNDLVFYTILQSLALTFVIFGIIDWLDRTSGLSTLHLISDWPVWAQILFFVVTHDFYIFAFHYWAHHNKYLMRLHEAHHSVQSGDWIAGSRSHSLEILINQTIEFAPIILLGAAPEVILYKGMIDAVWGMYIHANIDVKSGWLQYVINGPEMHRWHHSKSKGNGINYGTKFAFWDWIFGTAYLPEEKPKAYGLPDPHYPLSTTDTPIATRMWDDTKSYFLQQWYVFRPLKHAERHIPQRVKAQNNQEGQA